MGGSSAAHRWPGPEGRFHVKQGPRPSPVPRAGSPVDRRTCRRHAPVIPARSGWSVRTPSRLPYPRSHRGAYGPAGAIVTRCARHPPAPHYRRAVSLRGTGAAGPLRSSGGAASDRVGTAPPDFPMERCDPAQRQEKLSGRAFGYRATASAPSWPAGGPTTRSRTISTRVVGGSMMSMPHSCTVGSPPPSFATASACSAISSAGGRPLEGEQPAAADHQRQAPGGEPVQRRHRAGGHHVGRERADAVRPGGRLVGPTPEHPDRPGQPEPLHGLDEERGTPGQRLDQDDASGRGGRSPAPARAARLRSRRRSRWRPPGSARRRRRS